MRIPKNITTGRIDVNLPNGAKNWQLINHGHLNSTQIKALQKAGATTDKYRSVFVLPAVSKKEAIDFVTNTLQIAWAHLDSDRYVIWAKPASLSLPPRPTTRTDFNEGCPICAFDYGEHSYKVRMENSDLSKLGNPMTLYIETYVGGNKFVGQYTLYLNEWVNSYNFPMGTTPSVKLAMEHELDEIAAGVIRDVSFPAWVDLWHTYLAHKQMKRAENLIADLRAKIAELEGFLTIETIAWPPKLGERVYFMPALGIYSRGDSFTIHEGGHLEVVGIDGNMAQVKDSNENVYWVHGTQLV